MIKEVFNELLQSDLVTNKTKEVLKQRIDQTYAPVFFSAEEFKLLTSVCNHLVAQNDNHLVDVAGNIDNRLHQKTGPGWRYDILPPEGISYKTGLKGIQESAILSSGKDFTALSEKEKNNLLKEVQQGNGKGETWKSFSGKRFFELILTETAEHFYSHPNAQAEINYTGFADAKGWQVPDL
ncbi:MAG: gluconate 2-dehydrogenase subunit 3 family protein [Sphingobacteriaceae bacterium]|nr:MAG: gluconate 2-dehydrogenase subunit 3 family protein [Sphingobacteriaceae bacterium]